MIDATDVTTQIVQLSQQILPRCEGKQLILVCNKADLVSDIQNFPPHRLP